MYRRWIGLEGRDGPLVHLPSAGGTLEFENGAESTVEQLARGIAAMMAQAMGINMTLPSTPTPAEIQTELRGKDLACWCPIGAPCHADVLLELANQ